MRVAEFEEVDDGLDRSIADILGEEKPYVRLEPMDEPPSGHRTLFAVITSVIVGAVVAGLLVFMLRPHEAVAQPPAQRTVEEVEFYVPPECDAAFTFADRFMVSAVDLSRAQTVAFRAVVNDEPLQSTARIRALTDDLITAIDRYEVARDTCLDAS